MLDSEAAKRPVPWLFIGAGNMARAIATGARAAGTMEPDSIAAYDPEPVSAEPFGAVFDDIGQAAAWLQDHPLASILLATKPQKFGDVAASWRPVLAQRDTTLVVSILAGTTAHTVHEGLGPASRVVRVMPNTPIRLGMGMSAVVPGPGATVEDMQRVESVFASIGKTARMAEDLIDAFTGIAGSGPAYVFYLAEAMVEAGVQLGFDRADATQMARQTVMGAGALLAASSESPRELRSAVTSKGGTTAAAIELMDKNGVHDTVVRAIHAARHRGAELASG
ncbi:MAG: pyrroline-5-carboxylate reductase [Planctomycetota bacterium]